MLSQMRNILPFIPLLPLLVSASVARAEPAGSIARQVLDEWISNTETHVVLAADALPEDRFSFAPSVGEFHGVRTFAEQVKHLAANNYMAGAHILGEKPPHGERDERAPESVRTKAEIIEYVRGLFAYLHKAAATVNADTLVLPIPGATGTWQKTRLGWIVDAIAHSFDHYGQMVEYLRMNGVVPPDSR